MTAHGCPFEELGFDSIAELLQRVPGIDVSKPPDSVSLWCSVPHPSLTARQNHLILQREWVLSKKMPWWGGSDGRERERGWVRAMHVFTWCHCMSFLWLQLIDVNSLKKSSSVYARQAPPSKDVNTCPVYVTHIETPSCFCVQLIGEKTTKALENLQEDMTSFFNSTDGNAYVIKEPYVWQVSVEDSERVWWQKNSVYLLVTKFSCVLLVTGMLLHLQQWWLLVPLSRSYPSLTST